jgi:undecaprenyl-diphosphatase
VTAPFARLPRAVPLLGVAFLALITFVGMGLHASLDRAAATVLWRDAPCWAQNAGERASVIFAAELSLLYAFALAVLCLRAGRPLVGVWIVVFLLAGVGLEIAFKYYFDQPGPSSFLGSLGRPSCRDSAPGYPLTIVPTPSTLPSGYAIRATYFCLIVAALIGARWPLLRWPAGIGLGLLAVVLGASRVVVGWHWPSDVLAGLLVGAVAALFVLAGADGFAWVRATGRRVTGRRGRASGSSARPRRRSPQRR